MYRMGDPVEWLPMKQPMDEVEMERIKKWNRKQYQHKPNGMLAPVKIERKKLVRITPHKKHFIGRPQRHTADTTPKDVVPHLVTGKKLSIITAKLLVTKSELSILTFESIKIQMKTTHDQHEEH